MPDVSIDCLAERAVGFLSVLIRVRDIGLLTRETIRSTFRDDAGRAIAARFGAVATIEERAAIDAALSEFPADLVIRPTTPANGSPKAVAIYFVATNEHLGEALLPHEETERLDRRDVGVVALVEDMDMKGIGRRKFQRAQNRFLTMPIFRGDEQASLGVIERKLGLPRRG